MSNKFLEILKKIPVINKDASNPYYKKKYATLDNILEKINPIIWGCNAYLKNDIEQKDNFVILKTSLIDADTNDVLHSVAFSFIVNISDVQKFGALITYLRRYNLNVLLNLSLDDDDDGNGTVNREIKKDDIKKPGKEIKSNSKDKIIETYNDDNLNDPFFKKLKQIQEFVNKNEKLFDIKQLDFIADLENHAINNTLGKTPTQFLEHIWTSINKQVTDLLTKNNNDDLPIF